MEFKGTKGKWEVSEHSNETATIVTTPDTNVCNVFNGSFLGEQEANAKLIAAAPELLEALKESQEFLVQLGTNESGLAYHKSMQAINKALK